MKQSVRKNAYLRFNLVQKYKILISISWERKLDFKFWSQIERIYTDGVRITEKLDLPYSECSNNLWVPAAFSAFSASAIHSSRVSSTALTLSASSAFLMMTSQRAAFPFASSSFAAVIQMLFSVGIVIRALFKTFNHKLSFSNAKSTKLQFCTFGTILGLE